MLYGRATDHRCRLVLFTVGTVMVLMVVTVVVLGTVGLLTCVLHHYNQQYDPAVVPCALSSRTVTHHRLSTSPPPPPNRSTNNDNNNSDINNSNTATNTSSRRTAVSVGRPRVTTNPRGRAPHHWLACCRRRVRDGARGAPVASSANERTNERRCRRRRHMICNLFYSPQSRVGNAAPERFNSNVLIMIGSYG